MDKLRAMQLFVRLAELGSFTAVAEELGTSKSLVSKELARLEDTLGARLLHRSTRAARLTAIGEGYLERCRRALAGLDEAESWVQEAQGAPRGRLRINAPTSLGIADLGRAFAAFMAAYPEVELDVVLGDEPTDLVEQGFDLGLRVASRPFDSGYVGRVLRRFHQHLCAAPSYLAAHAPIRVPADLAAHDCLVYSNFRGGSVWPVGEGVTVHGTMRANSTLFLRDLALAGRGVGLMPCFVVRDAIARGELVDVLPGIELPPLTLHALYPARRLVPPRLVHCIDFLRDWFERHHGTGADSGGAAACGPLAAA